MTKTGIQLQQNFESCSKQNSISFWMCLFTHPSHLNYHNFRNLHYYRCVYFCSTWDCCVSCMIGTHWTQIVLRRNSVQSCYTHSLGEQKYDHKQLKPELDLDLKVFSSPQKGVLLHSLFAGMFSHTVCSSAKGQLNFFRYLIVKTLSTLSWFHNCFATHS